MPYEKLKEEHYSNLGGQNTKVSHYLTPEGAVLQLVNMDYTRAGAWTKVPGTTIFTGATIAGAITGLFQFSRLNGASYVIASANTNIYTVTIGGAFVPFRSSLQNNSLFDFVTFVDRLFCANGNDFFKSDGASSSKYSLPPGSTLTLTPSGSGSFTGYFQYAYGYLNDRGYQGPVSAFQGISLAGSITLAITGFTTPSDYGITSIIIYRSENNLLANVFQIGSIPAGGTLFGDNGLTLSSTINPPYIWFTLAPKYIKIFNNQLFMAGFSNALSTVWFSTIGEPEGVGITASFDVRTNDGDRITGFKNYQGQLMITKQRSFHTLSGDNPQNFTLQEQSDQYGCLSNRAMATFNDRFFFLDRKGIAEYNGANINIVSNPMESVFLRMNIPAALDMATMIHVKERNEVWTAFPVDGATLNNQMVVYDYFSNQWYERQGLNIGELALITSEKTYPTPFYGGYTGNIFSFGQSLCGDNGAAITCSVFTRFHSGDGTADVGQSTEKQFRRLWLDVDPLAVSVGGTVSVTVKLFANQGVSTPVFTTAMYGATWQTRIDYGVSAKSLAYQFIHSSATQTLRINGYTIAHRFQRAV